MMFGVLTVRLPPPGWQPPGYVRSAAASRRVAERDAERRRSARRSSGCCGRCCCLNVTAGIGMLGQASPMIQEMFPGRVTRRGRGRVRRPAQPVQHGRPVLLVVDCPTRSAASRRTRSSSRSARCCTRSRRRPGSSAAWCCSSLCYAVIMSMYGGGFATIPAYLRDLFGTAQVGAIHGRLLTAWSLRGRRRAGAGELPPRVPDRPRRAEGRRLHGHDVPDGRAAGRRVRVQPARRKSDR